MNHDLLLEKSTAVIDYCRKGDIHLSTMESCTGGGIAHWLTNVSGASDVVKGCCVTYSNQAKIEQGVPKKIIEKYTVYSPNVAREMALRAYFNPSSQIPMVGIGITGSLGRVDLANKKNSIPGTAHINFYNGMWFDPHTIVTPEEDRILGKEDYILQTLDHLLSYLPEAWSWHRSTTLQ